MRGNAKSEGVMGRDISHSPCVRLTVTQQLGAGRTSLHAVVASKMKSEAHRKAYKKVLCGEILSLHRYDAVQPTVNAMRGSCKNNTTYTLEVIGAKQFLIELLLRGTTVLLQWWSTWCVFCSFHGDEWPLQAAGIWRLQDST